MQSGPISVAVLIDLYDSPSAGGHVKAWHRLAEAAPKADDLDLTLYLLGDREGSRPIADNARVVTLPPVLGTSRVSPLPRDVGSTDLAPFHPRLGRRLARHDVWHATDPYAMGKTARRLAGRMHRPLVASRHTDLPAFTRVYARQVVTRHLGERVGGRLLLDTAHLDELFAALTRRQIQHVWRGCQHVFTSNGVDTTAAIEVLGDPSRVTHLRRGVDTTGFHPRLRDRAELGVRYGVPDGRRVVVFAGRVDASKGALLVARAVRRLRDAGQDVHLIAAGEGDDAPAIAELLGDAATLPGMVDQDDLARIYASADAFAFPSRTETIGNVVVEAMASGLPVVLAGHTATNQWLDEPGRDGVLVEADTDEAWAEGLGRLLTDEARRSALGERARRTVERVHPGWAEVLTEDLLPVWRRVAGRPG